MSSEHSARLSEITTWWTLLRQAHAGHTDAAREAQARLLDRYSVAVYRYLLASVRDPDAAQDLFQEFALRFVRGDFHRVNPVRGRFRDFLRTVLSHLVVDHQRQRRPLPLDAAPEPAASSESPQQEQDFLHHWREEILCRAFQALREWEEATGQLLYTVLRFRTDHPDLHAPEMALRLSGILGRPVTAEWVRNRLHFARQKFVDLLVEEVARTLGEPSHEELVRELIDLDLFERCRQALERRQSSSIT